MSNKQYSLITKDHSLSSQTRGSMNRGPSWSYTESLKYLRHCKIGKEVYSSSSWTYALLMEFVYNE